MVNNIVTGATGESRILKVVELFAHVKAQYGVPIIALSVCKPSFDLPELLKHGGVDAFFWVPFTLDEFRSALEACLKASTPAGTARQSYRTRPPRIVVVDDEDWLLEMLESSIRNKFKNVTIQTFQDSNEAWQELLRKDPDLLITRDKMPGLTGEDMVRRLVDKKVTYPIIVGGGWPPTEEWVRKLADKKSNLTFLLYPFTMEQLYEKLSKYLGPSDNPQRKFRNGEP